MVERFHRQLKEALRSRECGINWAAHLPWVLMGLRAAPKDDSGISSAELVYGQELRLPGQPTLNETGRVLAQLEGATHVYVLNGAKSSPLSPPYSGPYVVRRRGPKSFDIFVGGRLETISVDRLNLHRGHAVPVPAAPPVRGRPKRT
jgi:hypothetical protein